MSYRSMIGRRLVAAVAALGIASTGVPVLCAAAPAKVGEESSLALAQQVARLAGSGPGSVTAPANIEKIRREALVLQNDSNATVAARARRTLLWLDIMAAKTSSERHERIRALPVTVTRSGLADGRAGTLVQVIARGKVRFEYVIASTPSDPGETATEVSGPSDNAAFEECYDGPGPCVTEQEMEDLVILIADTQAEAEARTQELDTEFAEYQSYCQEYPSLCEISGGPSADLANCYSTAATAGVVAAGGMATLIIIDGSVSPMIAGGKVLSRTGWGALVVGAFVIGWGIGTAIDDAIQCFRNRGKLGHLVFELELSALTRKINYCVAKSGGDLLNGLEGRT